MSPFYVALTVTLTASLLGCGNNSKECEEAVQHISLGIMPADSKSYPKGEELAIIKTVIAVTLKKCTSEGLSRAQADCILAYQPFAEGTTMVTAMTTLSECPAIVQKRPSWLSMPTAEQLSELRQMEEDRLHDAGAAAN